MTRLPVREWTCSLHAAPQECDMGLFHCSECAESVWVVVGYRDPSGFEALLLDMPLRRFREPIVARAVLRDGAA